MSELSVFAACSVGVTSEPECTVKELTPVDKFMILASDGVWEFIESQDAVDIVGNCETVEEGCRQVSGSPQQSPVTVLLSVAVICLC